MSRFNKITSVSALLAITLSLISYNYASPAKADIVSSSECLPAILMLRGSGEARIGDQDTKDITKTLDYKIYRKSESSPVLIKTNGYEGEQISQLLEGFTKQTNPSETISNVRFIGIDYDALAVPFIGDETDDEISAIEHIRNYDASYNQGGQKVVETIRNDELKGCNTQYMLVGYSQGVISARIASNLMDNNTNKIISSYVIGDPYQKSYSAETENQKSPANTGYQFNGVATNAVNFATINPFIAPFIKEIEEYMTESDKLMYRNDEEKEIYSRSLCHNGDPVCATYSATSVDSPFDQHGNYFDQKTDPLSQDLPGDIDLQYEIEAFDQQVKTLAESITYNPRARVLKKTPSFRGFSTLYNVANARPDDRCSWDENSDGVYEAEDILCRSYESSGVEMSNQGYESMRVRVVDSFGTERFYNSNDQVIQTPELEEMFKIEDGQWYKFRLYENQLSEKDEKWGWYEDENGNYVEDPNWVEPNVANEDCLNWDLLTWRPIEEDSDYANRINSQYCSREASDQEAYQATMVFKQVEKENSNGGAVKTLVSGYDSDYSISSNFDSEYSYYENSLKLSKTPRTDEEISVKFNSIIDGIPYYNIKLTKNVREEGLTKCLGTSKEYDYYSYKLSLVDCDSSNTRQMFSALPAYGDFGSLSVEKDVTPPIEPVNLFLEVSGSETNLVWDYSRDRGHAPNYILSKYNPTTEEYDIINDDADYRFEPIDFTNVSENDLQMYSLKAVDDAGNESETAHISFFKPEGVSPPPAPEILDLNEQKIKLKMPSDPSNKAEGVILYRDGVRIGTHYLDEIVELNRTSRDFYTVRYKLQEKVFSESSDYIYPYE